MTIRIPIHISNTFIKQHPEYVFIYSSDIAGKSFFGQAHVAVGEPNCYPVYVMHKPCRSSGFFSDTQYLEIKTQNDAALHIAIEHSNSRPIIPFPGIGTGFSRMKEFAPKSWEYLHEQLANIAYKHLEFYYG